MSNVIELADHRDWEVRRESCWWCGHSWIATCPASMRTDRTERPSCELGAGCAVEIM
jgi:hypothetical protein